MGPDPDDCTEGHVTPPYHTGSHHSEEDILMSDASSHSSYPTSHPHPPNHPHTSSAVGFCDINFGPDSTPSSATPSTSALESEPSSSAGPPSYQLPSPSLSDVGSPGSSAASAEGVVGYSPWSSIEHDLAGTPINDDWAPISAIHVALDSVSTIGGMTALYASFGGPEEHFSQSDVGAGSLSSLLAQFPHHEPLPQTSAPSPQPPMFLDVDAGSWPTAVPVPGPVFPSLPPLVQVVNPDGAVSHQLQSLQNLQAAQGPDSESETPNQNGNGPLLAVYASVPAQVHPPVPAPPYPYPLEIPLHTLGVSHQNPNSLGPDNPQLFAFLRHWSDGLGPSVRPAPRLEEVELQQDQPDRTVHFDDLEGDRCDIQGLNWEAMGTTRNVARYQRLATYRNYVNRHRSDAWEPQYKLPNSSNFFRFHRMDIRRNVHLAHFQLRNVLSCVSRSLAFYPVVEGVQQINPVTGKSTGALDLKNVPGVQISTLSAQHGALVVGGFAGDYYIKSLDSIQDREPGYHEGQLTASTSGITNHVQVYQPRSSGAPLASFASNDMGFRTLDVETQKLISETMFDFPINCTAMSPDKRLRIMVGDHNDVLICNSETNQVLQSLRSHRDFGFACDWSENGHSVATGFQDMMVQIWDARRWTNSNGEPDPVATIKTNMAGARSLRFSPVGTGKPVLIAAEEADYLNIIDAETFETRQTIDIFGEICGVDFVNEGRELLMLSDDQDRGGLLRFERTRPSTAGGCSWKLYGASCPSFSQRYYRDSCPADCDGLL